MKKLFLLVLAVIPFAIFSCDVEKEDTDSANADPGKTEVDSTGIDTSNVVVLEETWFFDDYFHPFTFTFKDDAYTFETIGFKDQGTFTYEDSVITCTLTKRWSGEAGWEDGKRINLGNWEEIPLDEYTSRTFKVDLLENGVCIGFLTDDFYGGDPVEIMLIRQGMKLTINVSEVEGEWVIRDGRVLAARLLVEGNKYTIWQNQPYREEAASTKEKGTWSYADGYLTLTPDSSLYSFDRPTGSTDYVYSAVDPETLEAETWYPAEYELDPMKIPAYKSRDTFYMKMLDAEEIYKFKKK